MVTTTTTVVVMGLVIMFLLYGFFAWLSIAKQESLDLFFHSMSMNQVCGPQNTTA